MEEARRGEGQLQRDARARGVVLTVDARAHGADRADVEHFLEELDVEALERFFGSRTHRTQSGDV